MLLVFLSIPEEGSTNFW